MEEVGGEVHEAVVREGEIRQGRERVQRTIFDRRDLVAVQQQLLCNKNDTVVSVQFAELGI